MDEKNQINEMSEIITKICEKKKVIGSYTIATTLYNQNFRKQSEGAWVWKKKIEPQAQNRLYCSVCDDECLAKNNYYVKSNFCPHCGAKMKGGAE